MIHVFIDPAGTHNTGDYVLVFAKTGVTYEVQCGGYACQHQTAEGFLVSVGPAAAATALDDWFATEFRGHCHSPERDWTLERIERLVILVNAISCWKRDADGEDRPEFLVLDRARLEQCVEAWIPVITPMGPGVLVRENSD
jgi:hypothetical protein